MNQNPLTYTATNKNDSTVTVTVVDLIRRVLLCTRNDLHHNIILKLLTSEISRAPGVSFSVLLMWWGVD